MENITVKSSLKVALLAGMESIDFKVLYCLYREFNNIYVISNDKESILKSSRYKKKYIYIPWSAKSEDQENNIAAIKDFFDENGVDFIITGGCDSSIFLDKYKDSFPNQKFFPTLDYKTLQQIDHKWTFTEKLVKEDIPTPKTFYIDKESKIDETSRKRIEQEIGFPLMVKPVLSDGSLGVRKIKSFDALRDHIFGEHAYNDFPLVIQKFVEGSDASFCYLALNGEVLHFCIKVFLNEDEVEYYDHPEIEALGRKIIKFYKMTGPGNFDIRIDKHTGKIYVIECNPRFWRSVTASMWCGLNYPEAMIRKTMGLEYNAERPMGNYILTGKKVKMLARKPWKYFSFSKSEKEEIWFNLTDIGPQLALFMRRFKD
ncbi:MAG: ATP-grasp domain-containing protein [Emcibacteraceae bacterium]